MITDIILPALFPLALCQRPSNISICDFYTVKRFSENNSTNQYDFVSLLTNTAIIGTYTTPSEFHVPGALAPGDFNGTHIDLMPYFNGSMSSTNRGGKSGVSVNVLGDGGFKSVPGSRPAKTTTSDQFAFFTHMAEFFGYGLGCSLYAKGFTRYEGKTSMYEVHKFMALDAFQFGYLVQQVQLAAKSFGVDDDDLKQIEHNLLDLFGQRCAKEMSIVRGARSDLQAICIAENCPLAYDKNCSTYDAVVRPSATTETSTTTSGTSQASSTMTLKNGSAHSFGRDTATSLSATLALLAWLH